jgi:hypothetical protein
MRPSASRLVALLAQEHSKQGRIRWGTDFVCDHSVTVLRVQDGRQAAGVSREEWSALLDYRPALGDIARLP